MEGGWVRGEKKTVFQTGRSGAFQWVLKKNGEYLGKRKVERARCGRVVELGARGLKKKKKNKKNHKKKVPKEMQPLTFLPHLRKLKRKKKSARSVLQTKK